jgi:hypothetical protein
MATAKPTTTASSRRPHRRAAASGTPAFPGLALGIQNGLRRLVSDNASIVAQMLDSHGGNHVNDVNELCEKCATVMRQQQQMSPSTFLARFFDATLLSKHAVNVLQKSGKGSAAVLAERIAKEWLKNNNKKMAMPLLPSTPPSTVPSLQPVPSTKKAEQVPKKKKATVAAAVSSSLEATAAQPCHEKNQQEDQQDCNKEE